MGIEPNRSLADDPRPVRESDLPNGAPSFAELGRQEREASSGRLWIHRFTMLFFVFFCASLGVVLVVFPWKDEWARNSLLFGYPRLQAVVGSGFVRGLCSGLGVLDIWIGFWEAVHYHE
ncbi:MAG TPA: hypothetical protein VGF08_14685 [Terriglobales bacterium]